MDEVQVGDLVLHEESDVFGPARVLAVDYDQRDPRPSAWIKFCGRDRPTYRSVDICDLVLCNEKEHGTNA
jgi:hypothetical protein